MASSFKAVWAASSAPIFWFLSINVFVLMLFSSRQKTRSLCLPAFLSLSAASIWATRYSPFPYFTGLWIQMILIGSLHTVSLLFIERWPCPAELLSADDNASVFVFTAALASVHEGRLLSKSSRRCSRRSYIWKLQMAYRFWSNPQMINMSRQDITPSKVGEHGQYDKPRIKDKKQHNERLSNGGNTITDLKSPSHHELMFYMLRSAKIIVYYSIYSYVLPETFAAIFGETIPDDFGKTQSGVFDGLSSMTSRACKLRTWHALHWILESVLVLDGAHAVLAICFVSVGFDRPNNWPPLFGRLEQATSLRRFWSRFWHQMTIRSLKNIGFSFARHITGVKEGSVYNLVMAFVVFGLSGVLHALTAWVHGYRDWHLDIQWFLLNFGGCYIETIFRVILRRIASRLGVSDQLARMENSFLGYVLGYTWVSAFMFLTVPLWVFPRLKARAVLEQASQIDLLESIQT